ncbi:MAG TPA: flagellar basal body rod protein FlgB [Myxococcales bacterium]|jgi:flagellar basal-body rod protein FlgB|nr:flagellar basal body rod protein FlgB [Myxococcales bacterium]
MSLFDTTLWALERALDARLLRHTALAGNLANANTPGYQPRDVDFQAVLQQEQLSLPAPAAALAAEGRLSVPVPAVPGLSGAPPIAAATGAAAGMDGNKVDPDRTLAAIAQNALQYGAAARAAGKKLAILRYVASDGNA